jgi:hypothetical protein
MMQFISAFDDVVVNRYNRAREVKDRIQVKYVYAPKQRVLDDLINKSQHLTLPVIAVSQSAIARDESRVFNKIEGSYHSGKPPGDGTVAGVEYLPPPVPVNITINMSIMTKYQMDMEQILQNFVVYSNPYIVISWKVPIGLVTNVQEIRSEVLWDGNISMQYPFDIQANQPARVTADTTFTIKGWLFPYKAIDQGPPIYEIKSTFTPVDVINLTSGYDKGL